MDNTTKDDYEKLQKSFFGLCLPFDIDLKYIDKAWNDYKRIHENITLEGDQLHWLVCALYISLIEGDEVTGQQLRPKIALCDLLKVAKLSLLHFFQKICKWIEMGRYGNPMTQQIDQLERNFSVSSIVFEKYNSVFKDLFNIDWEETSSSKTRNKQKLLCSKKIFNFCWTLYICSKAHYPDINDDLVNSYHLMLCCIDFVFGNIITVKQFHAVINSNFQGYITDSSSKDNSVEATSIIDAVCQSHEGLSIETKIIRKQYLKSYIDILQKKNVLIGSSQKNLNLLDANNFEKNLDNLNATYEEVVVSNGLIDERLFISNDSNNRIGTPTKRVTTFTTSDERERSQVKRNLQEYFNNAKGLFPQTPLTGKRWVEKKIPSSEKVLQITMPVVRLQEITRGLKAAPSDNLKSLLGTIDQGAEGNIENILKEFKTLFLQNFDKSMASEDEKTSYSLPRNRLHLSTVLFYKIYEDFLLNDQKKNIEIKVFAQPLFIKCLFACSLEIVLCAYKSMRTFPWAINLFSLEPYHFFRVIELVIRTEELPRDVIKHLSRIEEKILESLTWESNSSIYQHMKSVGIPKCQDVSTDVVPLTTTQIFMSPIPVHKYTKESLLKSPLITSPASAAMNPALKSIGASPARRNLFGGKEQPNEQVTNKSESAILLSPKVNMTPPTTVTFPIMKFVPINTDSKLSESPARSRKKYGSLGIFFRKLYHLSYIRMKHLCDNLDINMDLQKKIWTCFEHSLVENNDMLRDRHLDQLLMCAVYVMCKVTKNEKSFHEIMKFYRTQPQASSDVYRRVLITRSTDSTDSKEQSKDEVVEKDEIVEKDEMKKEKTNDIGSEQSHNVYKDLIQFYNEIYIKKMKDFALKFAANKVVLDAPTLSPLPKTKKQVASPRKLTNQHQIFISPIKSVQVTPRSKMLYCFDSDTPKKLDEINAMIKSGTKRRVNLEENIIVSASQSENTLIKRTLNGVARKAEELQSFSYLQK